MNPFTDFVNITREPAHSLNTPGGLRKMVMLETRVRSTRKYTDCVEVLTLPDRFTRCESFPYRPFPLCLRFPKGLFRFR